MVEGCAESDGRGLDGREICVIEMSATVLCIDAEFARHVAIPLYYVEGANNALSVKMRGSLQCREAIVNDVVCLVMERSV